MNVSRTFIITINRTLALALALGLSACGSSVNNLGNVGVPGDAIIGSIADGIFRDSNVSGLKYSSASQSGVTDTSGAFKYITGETVTLKVGAITLGNSTVGKAVITPVDLAPNGTTTTSNVLNITRFLMLLDNDAEPRNGIVISDVVQGLAQNWPQIDFSSDLATALAAPYDINTNNSILGDLNAVQETHILPSAPTAAAHLESTQLCTYSGAFGGAYGGGSDSGTIALYIDPITGNADGFTLGLPNPSILALTHTIPLRFDLAPLPVMAAVTVDSSYTFQFADLDSLSGTWTASHSANNGTFSARRGGTDQTLQYRFAGSYKKDDGTDAGVFAFGIPTVTDPDNISITGQAFSVSTSANSNMSGTIVKSGPIGSVTAQTDDNKQFTGNMNLDINSVDYLSLSGTWGTSTNPAIPPAPAGTFVARGCLVF